MHIIGNDFAVGFGIKSRAHHAGCAVAKARHRIIDMREVMNAMFLNCADCRIVICRRVANRARQIQEFAVQYDKVIFVSGEKSSNGLYLFDLCRRINPQSWFVSRLQQLDDIPFAPDDSVGICGATSTPMWLMQEVADVLRSKQF